MKYQVIFLLCCGIRNSFQLDNICANKTTGRYDLCCYNYEWTNGKCNECKIGTTTEAGGRCMSCQNDTYGEKCGNMCDCDQTQRCDAKAGCIQKTSISTINTTFTGTIASLPNAATGIKNGTSNVEWIIYTICIACCFILTGFGHLFRTCKKRKSIKQRFINEEVALELLESTPYMGHYNEVDKKPFTFVTTVNAPSHKPQTETINFVFHEMISNTTCNVHDEAGYFDLYFVMKEDLNHQEENRSSQKQSLSTSFSNSNIFGHYNTEYYKACKPLQEYRQEDSQVCEVAVTVHQRIERSSRSEEDASGNIYSNVYQLVQKDRQLNSQANGNQLSPVSNTVHDKTLQTVIPSTFRTGILQDCTNKYTKSEKTIDACGTIESNKDKPIREEKSKTL